MAPTGALTKSAASLLGYLVFDLRRESVGGCRPEDRGRRPGQRKRHSHTTDDGDPGRGAAML